MQRSRGAGGDRRGGWRLTLREPVNALTHAAGAVLGIVGTVMLVARAGEEPVRVASAGVYGASLVVLFGASTLLHAVDAGARTLRALRTFDHAAIYLLIAGTYTPVTLVTLREAQPAWGWSLFAVAWALALAGIGFEVAGPQAPRWLSTGLYLAMGWLAVVAVVPLARALPWEGLAWLAAGGLVYTLGGVVYALQWPDPRPPVLGYHEIWHLFVLAGSACHFVLVYGFVLAG